VSVGVYCDWIKGHTLDYFLKKADELMYAEKYARKKENSVI